MVLFRVVALVFCGVGAGDVGVGVDGGCVGVDVGDVGGVVVVVVWLAVALGVGGGGIRLFAVVVTFAVGAAVASVWIVSVWPMSFVVVWHWWWCLWLI